MNSLFFPDYTFVMGGDAVPGVGTGLEDKHEVEGANVESGGKGGR